MPSRRKALSTNFDLAGSAEQNRDLIQSIETALSNANLDSSKINSVERLTKYLEWLNDKRPEFVPLGANTDDKFSEFISLGRLYKNTAEFYIDEVGVNATTVWRWATGKSRPSKYLAVSLLRDIKPILNEQTQKDIDVVSTQKFKHYENSTKYEM